MENTSFSLLFIYKLHQHMMHLKKLGCLLNLGLTRSLTSAML